jgi:membrane dipeptidase
LLDSEQLHKNSIIVDAHCDVLTAMEREKRSLGKKSGTGHVDLTRLKQGGVNVQFFAAYISPVYIPRALTRALELIDHFYAELEDNAQEIMLVKNFLGIQEALAQGKIAALLTIEGGEALNGSIEVLRILYRLGVRCLTLTWNNRNEIGDGVCEERTKGGLTRFGEEVVREMNQLRMLVDVSHLSVAGFWDVLEVSNWPVIASHSNCRKLCDHPRNLTDEQIKSLAAAGGVIGLSFYPEFIQAVEPSLDKLLDHVEHIAGVAGTDCIGLGSDFDGFQDTLFGLEDVSRLPVLTEGLLRRGFAGEEVQKILGGNFLRLLKNL